MEHSGRSGSHKGAGRAQNASPEACMEWVLSHMEDPGFNDPLEQPASTAPGPAAAASPVDAASVDMLQQMGFSQEQVGPRS